MLLTAVNFFTKGVLLLIILLGININSKAQNGKMVLTFSQEGKLLNGYTDRFEPNNSKNYKVDSTKKKGWQIERDTTLKPGSVNNKKDTLKRIDSVFERDTIIIKEKWVKKIKKKVKKENSVQLEVLIESTFFEKDEKAIKEIVKQARKVLDTNNNSILKAILGKDTKSLQDIFCDNNINLCKFDKPAFVPMELDDFVKVIAALKSGNVDELNKHTEMLPFKLFVGNQKNTTATWVKDKTAISENNSVKLVFDVPNKLFEKHSIEDFRLIRSFPLKEATINFINDLLEKEKESLPALLSVEKRIAGASAHLDEFIAELTEYLTLTKECNKAIRCPVAANFQTRVDSLNKSLTKHKTALESELGGIPCNYNDLKLDSGSILLCSPIQNWIAKTVWLNGSNIRLNPFSFTLPSRLNMGEPVDKESAKIKIAFWDKAITQLQTRSEKTADIGKEGSNVKKELDTLLKARKAAADVLTQNPDSINKAGTDKNRIAMNALLTTEQTLYKGWFVKYKSNKNSAYKYEKAWLRHYYIENDAEPLRQKLHFTYPEDENVTLMVHNVLANTTISVQESKKTFLDSAEFTVRAGKAVGQAASLYSLVGGVVPTVLKATQILNNLPNKGGESNNSLPEKVAKISASKNGSKYYLDSSLTPAKRQTMIESSFHFTQYTLDYAKALKQIADAPPLINQPLESRKDTTAVYYTYRHKLSTADTAYQMNYKISALSKNDTGGTVSRFIDSSYIKVGKYHYVQLAAGLAYSPNAGVITTVDTSGGGFKINRDEDRFRLMVGLRFYPFGEYNQNKLENWRLLHHRLSVLLATGIPKPLQNFYIGGGYDIVPGFCISGGFHFQQSNQYTIQNNTVAARNISYKRNGFVSFTIDPALLVTAVTSLF